jgi:catechol 2,3-dioxygenase-like lactoylglutathione lyase family enzyme
MTPKPLRGLLRVENVTSMLTAVNPKLPMRNKGVTRDFYVSKLGFVDVGIADFPNYLIVQKDAIEVHLFLFDTLDPLENYGQIYLHTNAIDQLYDLFQKQGVVLHPAGELQTKPWGMKEFALLDPDNNLLTFGQRTT